MTAAGFPLMQAYWMKVRPLRRYDLPDMADHVIHFTGRADSQVKLDPAIGAMSDEQRLLQILLEGRVRSFTTFGGGDAVACLTESTKPSISSLLCERRYTPCGVGFTKQFVFDCGGGPALYIRGDEWEATKALPAALRSRVVRFWPGADAEQVEVIPTSMSGRSEWLHEREWRVPGDLKFGWDDVEFLIVRHSDWQSSCSSLVESQADENVAGWFASIPAVVMSQDGVVVCDDTGIWP
jgi:hypothetical protein